MNFIDHYMRKTNRNFILLTLGIFMIAIWLSYTNWQLISSLLMGPRQFSAEQLRSMKDPKDRPDGLVNISQAVDDYHFPVMSEFNEASVAGTKIGEKKVAYDFAYVRLGEKYLIVRTEPEAYTGSPLQLVGQLEPLSTSTRANFIKYSGITGINRNLLPFELNTSHDFNFRALIICLLVGMVVATAIINTYQLIRRIIQPQRHIIYRRIAQQGDPEQIIQQLDAELSEGNYREVDQYLITKSWIIKRGKLSLKIAKNYFVPGSSYILDDVF